MTGEHQKNDDDFLRNVVEASVRVGLIALLVILCYEIVRPLIGPVIWGAILAISFLPGFLHISKWLNGREVLAAILITLFALVFIIVPIGLISVLIVDNFQALATNFNDGTLKIPLPPEFILKIPLIGKPIDDFWTLASQNLEALINQFEPQIKSLAGLLFKSGAKIGLGLLMFIVAIIIAGVMLTQAAPARRATISAANRFIGEQGEGFVQLAGNTVRNVAIGVVGVALIQGILAGVGLFAAGIPIAGLIIFSIILLTIIQIGPSLVIIPTIIYAFLYLDTMTAILFTVWIVPVMLIDNVLKPILMARGIDVPMLVIFVGVIGGTLAYGLTGLFVGPVVLALGYNIISAWIYGVPATAGSGALPAGEKSAKSD